MATINICFWQIFATWQQKIRLANLTKGFFGIFEENLSYLEKKG